MIAKEYIDSYFGAYKNAVEIKFDEEVNEEREPAQIVMALLNRPVLINRRSTYVDLNFSGPAIDFCKRFTYFDGGKTVVEGANQDDIIVPQDYDYSGILQGIGISRDIENSFIRTIHEFPKLKLADKTSCFEDIMERFSTHKVAGRVFCTRIPVYGNIDLFNIISNGLISPVQVERVNSSIQKGAIRADAEKWAIMESYIKICFAVESGLNEKDELVVRELQSKTKNAIHDLQERLSSVEAEFNLVKDRTRKELINLIEHSRVAKLDAIQQALNLKQQEDAFKKLMNDF